MSVRDREGRHRGGPRYLTTSQVARLVGVSAPTVVKWVESGELRAHRTPGGHRRIAETDLQQFSEARGLRATFEAEAPPARPCVVVVDAGLEFTSMLKRVLAARLDVDVLAANDAFSAGLLCGQHRPLVVVVDPAMADLDPWAAFEQLRQAGGPAIVALSAVVGTEVKALQSRGLVDEVLTKPHDLPALWELVSRLVAERRTP